MNRVSIIEWVVKMHFLDFGPMKESDMAEYLGEVDGLEDRIQEMLQEEYSKLESFEECIQRKSFRSFAPDISPDSQHQIATTDTVYSILTSVQRDMEQQSRDISQQILKLVEGREKLNHVKYCIRSLPSDQADLITYIYVKREGQKAYSKKKYLSTSTVSRRTKIAMDNLLALYNARFTRSKAGAPG